MQKSSQMSHVKPAQDIKLDYSFKMKKSLYTLILIIKSHMTFAQHFHGHFKGSASK